MPARAQADVPVSYPPRVVWSRNVRGSRLVQREMVVLKARPTTVVDKRPRLSSEPIRRLGLSRRMGCPASRSEAAPDCGSLIDATAPPWLGVTSPERCNSFPAQAPTPELHSSRCLRRPRRCSASASARCSALSSLSSLVDPSTSVKAEGDGAGRHVVTHRRPPPRARARQLRQM